MLKNIKIYLCLFVIVAVAGMLVVGAIALDRLHTDKLLVIAGSIAGFFLFLACIAVVIGRSVQGIFRAMRFEMLKNLINVGIESGETIVHLAHMKQSVDDVSNQSQAMASAVEEMVASIKQISEGTKTVSSDSQDAGHSVDTGVQLSKDGVTAMEKISTTADLAAQGVNALAEESTKIGEIVSQIESIASQTNLLALNATIESARAGEAGKGFAVVASEVKGLANQTSRSTGDIQNRIESFRTRINDIVCSMQQSVIAVTQGRDVVEGLGKQLHDISYRINDVSVHMTEMASILTQQSAVTNDISKGTHAIADISQKNTGGIHDVLNLMDRLGDIINKQIGSFVDLGPRAIVEIAKNDHINFKKNVADVLVGRKSMRADELSTHHTCRLGKWYDNVKDKTLLNDPAFRALIVPHQMVHDCGKEALHCLEQGLHGEAAKALQHLGDASHEVLKNLERLGQNIAEREASVLMAST